MESLKQGKERASNLLSNLRFKKPEFAAFEMWGGGNNIRIFLSNYANEIDLIKSLGMNIIPDKELTPVTNKAIDILNTYLRCIEDMPKREE